MIHLGVENPLGQRLLQIVEQAIRVEGRLWIGAGQQLVEDGVRNARFFASRHGRAPLLPSCPTPHEIPDSPRGREAGEARGPELGPDSFKLNPALSAARRSSAATEAKRQQPTSPAPTTSTRARFHGSGPERAWPCQTISARYSSATPTTAPTIRAVSRLSKKLRSEGLTVF